MPLGTTIEGQLWYKYIPLRVVPHANQQQIASALLYPFAMQTLQPLGILYYAFNHQKKKIL